MSEDFGLYLSLTADGHIKRDLAGPAGKVSLEDVTIRDELISFSELSFTPHAQVVDMIHTSVVYLCEGSNSNDGVVDSNVYNFILKTVTDLANTLMEESPVHGLLLWTAIEDHVTEDDPVQTCWELLATLTETMQFQFVVNEVLYDLSGTKSLAPEKYEGLWEMSVTDVLTLEETGIITQYHFRSTVDYYHFLLLHFVAGKTNVARCQCCGRYFIPRTKKKTLYCDRILKDEKTCKEWGPVLKHRKEVKDNAVVEAFDRIKRKMYKRYERAEYGINQKTSEKDLSYTEYYQWLDRATKARDEYLAGKLNKAEALNIIKQDQLCRSISSGTTTEHK